jgi:DNA-binding transcriptional regulator YiaG
VVVRTVRDVKALRRSLGFTQRQLAGLLRVKLSTLQGWEGGRHDPRGPNRTVLQLLAAEPETVMRVLLAGRPALKPTMHPAAPKKSP